MHAEIRGHNVAIQYDFYHYFGWSSSGAVTGRVCEHPYVQPVL
jgi:hypothetical protein